MAFGLYGKHPARGDFLLSGLPGALAAPLEGWLDTALAGAREALGPRWETVWDGSGNDGAGLRFWIGEAVWGQALCGVLLPSRDGVGRRFPLLVLWSDPDPAALPPPPAIDPDQGWYAALAGQLRGLRDGPGPTPGEGAAALLAAFPPPAPPPWAPAPGPEGFWAERMAGPAPETGPVSAGTEPDFPEPEPEPEPESTGTGPDPAGGEPAPAPPETAARLLADIALADHRRAAAGRGYFWTEAGPATPARIHAGPGLPDGAVLGWLLGGAA